MRAALCVRRGVRVLALAALVGQLVGCALPAREQLGALRAEVVARLGPPTATIALPSGERLLYSELPAGFAAYHLDFDTSGRLLRNEQVLTQQRFENLPIGTWTRADLQNTFGMPLRVEQVARFDGDIWTSASGRTRTCVRPMCTWTARGWCARCCSPTSCRILTTRVIDGMGRPAGPPRPAPT